jgi:uncharacterized protein YjbI with pentapeptide repeats
MLYCANILAKTHSKSGGYWRELLVLILSFLIFKVICSIILQVLLFIRKFIMPLFSNLPKELAKREIKKFYNPANTNRSSIKLDAQVMRELKNLATNDEEAKYLLQIIAFSNEAIKIQNIDLVYFRIEMDGILKAKAIEDDPLALSILATLTGRYEKQHDKNTIIENVNEVKELLKKLQGRIFVNLSFSNLCEIDLSEIDLRGIDFSYCKLTSARFKNANLQNANLSYSNLRYASFEGANLDDTNFNDAKNVPPFALNFRK